jgi:hypothetical protein
MQDIFFQIIPIEPLTSLDSMFYVNQNLSESFALITHKGALVAAQFLKFFIFRITKRILPAMVRTWAFNLLAMDPEVGFEILLACSE